MGSGGAGASRDSMRARLSRAARHESLWAIRYKSASSHALSGKERCRLCFSRHAWTRTSPTSSSGWGHRRRSGQAQRDIAPHRGQSRVTHPDRVSRFFETPHDRRAVQPSTHYPTQCRYRRSMRSHAQPPAVSGDGDGSISGWRSLMICETRRSSITSKLIISPTFRSAHTSRGP